MPKSRWLIAVVAVVCVAAVVVAVRAFSPKKQQQLNVFIWTEYLPQSVIDAFSKEYGVKVNYDTYSSNEEMLAKLTAGASGYDVIVPSDHIVTILLNKDLLLPLDKEQLPNLVNIDPQFLDKDFDPGNKYTVPYMWGTVGIAVNTEKVKEKITSAKDLWNPKYKGRIVLLDDPREIIGLTLQMLGKSRNSTNPADLEAAKAKLKELLPSVKAFDSDSPKSLLLSGEAYLGVVWSGEAALANIENPNIAYVIPSEGGGMWMDNLAIPKTSKNKELAQKFINFLLRPEVSVELSKAYPYGNPNKAALALLDPKLLANKASYPPAESLKHVEWLKDVGAATTEYDRVWTELKGE